MKTIARDVELLEIREIKEISSIHYKDLFQPTPNGKKRLNQGFIITYGPTDKIMFLMETDPYFDEFVKRIREVYLEEKGHIIREGILGKEYIEIDTLTEQMLLNGHLDENNTLYQEYANQEAYEDSLLMEEDQVKALFPIIQYHLKEFLKMFSKTLTNIELSNGNNGIYTIKATLDNIPTTIPILIEWDDTKWKVTFGNILQKSIPIAMMGTMSEKKITIKTYLLEYHYEDQTDYKISNDSIEEERTIRYQGNRIYLKTNKLPQVTEQIPVTTIDLDSKNITWYQLPWDSYLGLYEEKCYFTEDGEPTEEEQQERIVTNKIIYLSQSKNHFLIKEIATKRFHKKIDDRTEGGNIPLDYMNKRRIGIIDQDTTTVETHFTGNGVTGKYKKSLAGKYYYEVYAKDQKFFLSREDGLLEKSDLFEPKRYLKKEEE